MRKHGSSSKWHLLAHIKVLVELTSEMVIDMGVVCQVLVSSGDFPGGSVRKNLPASAWDVSSIPGLGRSFGGGNGNIHSSILAWRIPWTGEPVWLQFMGSQKVKHDLATEHACSVLCGKISVLQRWVSDWSSWRYLKGDWRAWRALDNAFPYPCHLETRGSASPSFYRYLF